MTFRFRGERRLPTQRAFRPADLKELDRQQLVEPPQRFQQRDGALRRLRRRPERAVVHPERERRQRLQQRHRDGDHRGNDDAAAGRAGFLRRDQRAARVRHEGTAWERNFVIVNGVCNTYVKPNRISSKSTSVRIREQCNRNRIKRAPAIVGGYVKKILACITYSRVGPLCQRTVMLPSNKILLTLTHQASWLYSFFPSSLFGK